MRLLKKYDGCLKITLGSFNFSAIHRNQLGILQIFFPSVIIPLSLQKKMIVGTLIWRDQLLLNTTSFMQLLWNNQVLQCWTTWLDLVLQMFKHEYIWICSHSVWTLTCKLSCAGGSFSKRDDGGLLGPGCRGPPYSSVCWRATRRAAPYMGPRQVRQPHTEPHVHHPTQWEVENNTQLILQW